MQKLTARKFQDVPPWQHQSYLTSRISKRGGFGGTVNRQLSEVHLTQRQRCERFGPARVRRLVKESHDYIMGLISLAGLDIRKG
jgi:hypothetical protein